MENDNIFLIIFCWLSSLIGLIHWGALVLLLMEVVICKDATAVNAGRILSKSAGARLRLFKRSLKSYFYKASIGLFIGSIMAMFYMMEKIWTEIDVNDFYPWTLFSLFFPICLYVVYREIGYESTFFNKFKKFLRKEED